VIQLMSIAQHLVATIRLICAIVLASSVHVTGLLLIVRIRRTAIDMRKRHNIRVTTTVTSRRRVNACITSAMFLRLDTSASVEEATRGCKTEFSGRSFLVAAVVGVGLAGAAAAAEEPEEGGEEDEGGGEPCYSQEMSRQANLDIVILEFLVQGGDEDAKHDSSGDRTSKDENGRDDGANPSQKAAEARAHGEYTKHNGEHQGPETCKVCGKHPLAQLLVQVDGFASTAVKNLVVEGIGIASDV